MKIRMETALMLLVLAGGGLAAAIGGLFVYVRATTKPIHADLGDVPSAALGTPPPRWAAAVEQGRSLARAGIIGQNLPGLSVAVGVRGDVVWAEGFGWANIEERKRVTPETRFRIGTASTMLTSAAVGTLLEQGRLKLDDEIQTYVPAFPKKPWPVTLRQLMAHVAGIRPDSGDEENVFAGCERTGDGLQRFADAALLFQPGTAYRYSTYGWILVSAAVEAAANERFPSVMRSRVFEPLAMAQTRGDSATEPSADTSASYFPRFGADTRYGPQEPDDLDYSCFSGASGFLSTPADLVRFGMAIDGGTLLKPATVQLLQAPQRLASGEDTGYGLGWDLETVTIGATPQRLVVEDGMLRGGRVSTYIADPKRGLVVSVMSNTSFTDTTAIATDILEAFAAASER